MEPSPLIYHVLFYSRLIYHEQLRKCNTQLKFKIGRCRPSFHPKK